MINILNQDGKYLVLKKGESILLDYNEMMQIHWYMDELLKRGDVETSLADNEEDLSETFKDYWTNKSFVDCFKEELYQDFIDKCDDYEFSEGGRTCLDEAYYSTKRKFSNLVNVLDLYHEIKEYLASGKKNPIEFLNNSVLFRNEIDFIEFKLDSGKTDVVFYKKRGDSICRADDEIRSLSWTLSDENELYDILEVLRIELYTLSPELSMKDFLDQF